MSAYEDGYTAGRYRKEHDDYDVRWDMADHAKAGTLAEFRRGFDAGFNGSE